MWGLSEKMLTEQRDSMKTGVSPEGPEGSIFQAEELQHKGQNDDSGFGHVESEVTFIYPDGDIHSGKIYRADTQQSVLEVDWELLAY